MGRVKKKSALPPDVVKVRQGIERWRKTRAKRTRMPEELWRAAVALAQVQGIYEISQALRVSYGTLKKRLGAAKATPAKKRGRRKKKAVFVELEPAWGGVGPARCVVELRKPSGTTMTIRLTDTSILDIAELTDMFWSRRR